MTRMDMGWDALLESRFAQLNREGLTPARVVTTNRGVYTVRTEKADLTAELAGRFRFDADPDEGVPVVGDWVAMEVREGEGRGTIHALLPRRTAISRKRAGRTTDEQVLAANVDTAFLVSALDGGRNLNPRRLERYLVLAWESGADPLIVLNKVDLCNDLDEIMPTVEAVAGGAPVLAVSATEGTGVEALRGHLATGRTAVLLGMSGVGKSALINALTGAADQRVGGIRETDHRGRHTTTQSRLVLVPGGGMIIDTAGLRELQPWTGDAGTESAFSEIEDLARRCRFHDCRHEREPDCAVQAALAAGKLDIARFENYLQLRKEQAFLARKIDERAARAEREKWKRIARDCRAQKKTREKG